MAKKIISREELKKLVDSGVGTVQAELSEIGRFTQEHVAEILPRVVRLYEKRGNYAEASFFAMYAEDYRNMERLAALGMEKARKDGDVRLAISLAERAGQSEKAVEFCAEIGGYGHAARIICNLKGLGNLERVERLLEAYRGTPVIVEYEQCLK